MSGLGCNKDCVILLHGLARTSRSLSKMNIALINAGFHTINQDYQSTKYNIKALANQAIYSALTKCPPGNNIHFVTHSMGGILVRQYLSDHTIDNLGRVVMLGPPNKGSEVVDKLKKYFLFRFVNGPAGIELATGKEDTPKRLGVAKCELGIIAGTRSVNLILSMMLPKPNDGKVSVDSTMLEGMSEHITLPVTHSFMMNNNETIHQTLRFLKGGSFD